MLRRPQRNEGWLNNNLQRRHWNSKLNQQIGKFPSRSRSFFKKLLGWTQAVALAVWFGSMVFVSFIGAPTAFQLLNDTRTAGTVVGGMLDKFYLLGYGMLGVVLCVSLIQVALGYLSSLRFAGLVFVLLIGVGVNVYAREVVARRMGEIRRNIDHALTPADQEHLRGAFDTLHRSSVWLMGGSMIIGLVLIYMVNVGDEKTKEANRWRL